MERPKWLGGKKCYCTKCGENVKFKKKGKRIYCPKCGKDLTEHARSMESLKKPTVQAPSPPPVVKKKITTKPIKKPKPTAKQASESITKAIEDIGKDEFQKAKNFNFETLVESLEERYKEKHKPVSTKCKFKWEFKSGTSWRIHIFAFFDRFVCIPVIDGIAHIPKEEKASDELLVKVLKIMSNVNNLRGDHTRYTNLLKNFRIHTIEDDTNKHFNDVIPGTCGIRLIFITDGKKVEKSFKGNEIILLVKGNVGKGSLEGNRNIIIVQGNVGKNCCARNEGIILVTGDIYESSKKDGVIELSRLGDRAQGYADWIEDKFNKCKEDYVMGNITSQQPAVLKQEIEKGLGDIKAWLEQTGETETTPGITTEKDLADILKFAEEVMDETHDNIVEIKENLTKLQGYKDFLILLKTPTEEEQKEKDECMKTVGDAIRKVKYEKNELIRANISKLELVQVLKLLTKDEKKVREIDVRLEKREYTNEDDKRADYIKLTSILAEAKEIKKRISSDDTENTKRVDALIKQVLDFIMKEEERRRNETLQRLKGKKVSDDR